MSVYTDGLFPKCQLSKCQLPKYQLSKCQLPKCQLNIFYYKIHSYFITYHNLSVWSTYRMFDQYQRRTLTLVVRIWKWNYFITYHNLSVWSTYRMFDQYQRRTLTLVTHYKNWNHSPLTQQLSQWDFEFIETQKGGRALLSGGYGYWELEKENVSGTNVNNRIPWCYWTSNWTLVT